MIDALLSLTAPHHCYGCDKTGTLLCDNCKYDITDESFLHCVSCGRRSAERNGLCGTCRLPYARAWCVGWRTDVLRELLDAYKFSRTQAADIPLADLLHRQLPVLPPDAVLVPIPTIAKHMRQRGYDHMARIAHRLSQQRGLSVSRCLERRTSHIQHGATASVRRKQAKEAFAVRGTLNPDLAYILLDDVVTTGSTMKFAAKALKDAGASTIWVATITRQPLDESDKI